MIDRVKRIYDISIPLTEHLPVWPTSEKFNITWVKNIDQDGVNESHLSFNTHSGTHIDLPYHFLKSGKKMGDISLDRLIGKALVLEYHGDRNIGPELLSKVTLPSGCRKLLFKTLNSVKYLMEQNGFSEDYVALSLEGAEWVVKNGIDLVGIDYLSIQSFNDKDSRIHKTLLENNIVILEGLNLRDVGEGVYELFVLPLNIPEAEGAPARAILIKEDT
jgi:arylformamidase